MRPRIRLAALCMVVSVVILAFLVLRSALSRSDKSSSSPSITQDDFASTTSAFTSILERLPRGKPIPPIHALSDVARMRWEVLDLKWRLAQEHRASQLEMLHEKTRQAFVTSPGAGAERSVGFFSMDGPPRQPGEHVDSAAFQTGELSRIAPNSEFQLYHEVSLWTFLNPSDFGYIKDRANVAGFKSHGFGKSSRMFFESSVWPVQRVELIGMLTNENPVVYLTDKMPSMEQIRQGRTRSLDSFEESGLPFLRDGDDYFILSNGGVVRMLGALRATKVCQQCHEAEMGDLLGAFSYTLRSMTIGVNRQ